MVALPAATAVTRPEAETVAAAELLDVQLTTRPLSTLLLASRVTAENCSVAPTCIVAGEGDTDTAATGTAGGTATLSVEPAVLPSLLAETIAVPEPTATMSPVCATVATL